ncbi:MAG: helix-turn-helix transcriptional regulator [Saprospiraceae bacterium]|nr:helix-turn-helix transcriptional regulator [Saprospiraceae bacterium]
MTKKEKILEAGLKLFATEGYTATSTNKIANAAGVSEALIFRHFLSKEGLLSAIVKEGESAFKNLYTPILKESDPKEVIRLTIALPLTVPESHYEFWRLQFRLKWELQSVNHKKSQPLIDKLSWAFAELGVAHPKQEAEFLSDYLEGLASQILLGKEVNKKKTEEFLLLKYKLT